MYVHSEYCAQALWNSGVFDGSLGVVRFDYPLTTLIGHDHHAILPGAEHRQPRRPNAIASANLLGSRSKPFVWRTSRPPVRPIFETANPLIPPPLRC